MADPTYNITWGFQSEKPLDVINGGDDDGLVTTVHWNLSCISSDGYNGYHYDAMYLEKGSSVIPLKDLTKDQVIGWIKQKTFPLPSESGARTIFYRSLKGLPTRIQKTIGHGS